MLGTISSCPYWFYKTENIREDRDTKENWGKRMEALGGAEEEVAWKKSIEEQIKIIGAIGTTDSP